MINIQDKEILTTTPMLLVYRAEENLSVNLA
jgi:hypothetical protein